MTITTEDLMRRETMQEFLRRTGWSFVLKEPATERWDQEVKIIIAEKGTFRDVPVKAWTNTATGTIFLREELFDGIDLTRLVYRYAIQATIHRLVAGDPINRPRMLSHVRQRFYPDAAEVETIWKIAQTVTAAYGVFGHEYCHAAYSEHAARNAWHMGLEDLRGESLWMAQDPIRARQGLRACASSWVTHDASPMTGIKEFDLSKITSHASLLHLYLLVVGRGRIGVLDDQSKLVVGVQNLTAQILGWETVSDANDIIDRFLETSEDPLDRVGAAEREALAEEFSRLLPEDGIGEPEPGIGCFPQSKDQDDDPQAGSDPEKSEGEPGKGGGEPSEGGGEPSEGDGDGEGEGDGGSQPGDEDSEESEDTSSGTGDIGDDADDADDGADKSRGKDGGDEGDEDGDDAGEGEDGDSDIIENLTIGTNVGDGGGSESDGTKGEKADFVTGTFGETIRPGEENVTDELDESGAHRLTQEQVEALAEVLAQGLEEVSASEGEAGWAISDSAGVLLKSRSTAPSKVASEVFSRKALTTRNRRLKAGDR